MKMIYKKNRLQIKHDSCIENWNQLQIKYKLCFQITDTQIGETTTPSSD